MGSGGGPTGLFDDCLSLQKQARDLADAEFALGIAESIALGAGAWMTWAPVGS